MYWLAHLCVNGVTKIKKDIPLTDRPRGNCGVLVACTLSLAYACRMLTVKCAACRRKLWKYLKLGPGEVLRCHKDRITREFDFEVRDGKIRCLCGKPVGIDKGSYYSMVKGSFTYAGTKDPKR
ncbi:hypothetical protein Dde_3025 [Oleidesulfovibrio alaskensis G20]|jgi:hypothetical protein|uniref:Uncharacterized protein n=2 Tax=Oleidesulfovibrio alaskensis TaxID=58180 RepID=Q30WX7_OLEA2|nr:hypothetical protein Dde_3025 [Oleidesulfovibrio alaskensis G20]